MNRRDFLQGAGGVAGMLGLAGCARKLPVTASSAGLPFYDARCINAGTGSGARGPASSALQSAQGPFRAQGPRIEAEKVGDKVVVHNYGHGGSGWSLSWGSSAIAVKMAMEAAQQGGRDIAVIGAGALGLTSATLLQRAGAKVTIYAKEQAPYTRSSRATGGWTPDSRVAFESKAAPGFAERWEEMARTSWFMYQSYLGMAGNPIEYMDHYQLSDGGPGPGQANRAEPVGADGTVLDFARYQSRISDITPRSIDLPPGSHPFPTKYARRNTTLTFNVADYSRQLLTDFLIAGGKIETTEFHSPSELSALPQKVIINCPGYGGRALWKDESITPVRGQIAWLIPQDDVHYGLGFEDLNILARRDGIVVQSNEQGEASGWNDTNENPDRGEANRGVQKLAALYAPNMGAMQTRKQVSA